MPASQATRRAITTLMMIMEKFIKEENIIMKTESVTPGHHCHATTPQQTTTTDLLPVSAIRNVIATPPAAGGYDHERYYDCEPDGADECYFDARSQQPWLAAESAGWSWHSLAQQIKHALHSQLHTLSHTTMAASLLHTIPADLSKLLAAALLCSSQGKDILWQSGIFGGLELINHFIHLLAGTGTSAALLTSLPPLLLIWLTRQHISLTETVMNSLSLLLTTGLTICAAADFSQPAWLLQLDEQVIAPVSQLLRDTGITHIVTSGVTLLLGCYVMLRLCSGFTQKIPQANLINYGLRLITNLSQLCATSRVYQRQHLLNQQTQQSTNWYERTYGKPYQQSAAATALQRAVIRCLPEEVLHQRETLSTAEFHQAYQHVEQQILQQHSPACPHRDKNQLPPGQHQAAAATPVSSSSTHQSTPLLMPAAAAAGAVVAHGAGWHGRTAALSLAAAAAGATLLAGARYLRDSVSPASTTAPQESDKGSSDNNICLEMINKIRSLLGSNNSGATLSAELFSYLFDTYGNLRIQRASRYLNVLGVNTFNATARDEMNEQLRHTLSLLWSRENNNQPVDVSQIIINLQKHIFSLWAFLIKNKKNVIIKNVLKELRLYCAKEYLVMGMYSRLSMDKITNFLLSLAVPDLLLLESNGLDNENVISKKNYCVWNFIGRIFTENRHLRHDDLAIALRTGWEDASVIARARSYANYNATKNREELEETYKELNKQIYHYHKLDTELEVMQILQLDNIIEIFYPDIKLADTVNLKNYPFLIKTQAMIDKNIRILRECKNFRDIIRNFNDGLEILYQYAPNEVPEKLRVYDESKKSFTLKPHLTRAELYEKFEHAYNEMVEKHCELYLGILNDAFEILHDEDIEFLHRKSIEIYNIKIRVERFKLLRNIFMPIAFSYHPAALERISYNNRPYYETGKIFIAYDRLTGEKVYYAGHVDISRVETRRFPVWRLPINSTEEILSLDPEYLNTNYLFSDEQSLFDRCPDAKKPAINFMSRWNETGEFFKQYYGYYTAELCAGVRHPSQIKITFQEIRLGDNQTSPLSALKAEMTDNRRKLLLSMKGKALSPTGHEMKSQSQQLIEMIPLYNCYAFAKNIVDYEDTAPPSLMMQFFQATLCAADLFTGHGVVALMKSLKHKYASLWLKKHEFTVLRKEIDKVLKRTTPPIDRTTLIQKMNDIRKQMDEIEGQIAGLRKNIHNALGNVLITPLFIAFPYLSLRKGREIFASSLLPWGINLGKTAIKKIISGQKNRELKYIWHNPSAGKLIEYEHYYLPYPDASNSSCHTEPKKNDNIILNIFELRHTAPELYKTLHFTALTSPTPADIMSAAKENDVVIPEDHNQMAMFSFITLTIPPRFYSGMILILEDYYKTDKNDIKITQQALYQYYDDALQKPYITPPVELQPEQQLLITATINTLSSLVQSTIQGIEINYLFMIHYFLLQEDISTLLVAIQNKPENKLRIQEKLQRNLAFNLEKFTLFGSVSSTIQNNFYATVIERYINFCQKTVAENPRNHLLFSPTIDSFLQQLAKYGGGTDDARHPGPADYVHHWQQTDELLLKIYQSFARIEYSAKALAAFPAEQWQDEQALSAWRLALDDYLFPEMRYENLLPLLRDSAQELGKIWRARRQQPDGKTEIINGGEVNPLFIDDVAHALKKSCPRYPKLFFCMVYQIDHGRWFTPLNNDFIAESQIRSTRQAHAIYPAIPLTEEPVPPLKATIIAPLLQSLMQWQSTLQSSTILYQQYLTHLLESFLRDISLPFHQRWQGYLPGAPTPAATHQQHDASTLINALIDPQGHIIDYQLCLFRHHLPQTAFPDHYPVLQLLSDMLQLTRPGSPPLYRFIFDHLQQSLSAPQLSLSTLRRADFAERQIREIQRAFIARLQDVTPQLQQTSARYIVATVRHLLTFAHYLPQPDALIAEAPLSTLAVQWLNLGAIIALQLRLENATSEDLLAISWAAQHDAGLLSLRETAIQQLALLSGNPPAEPTRNEGQDALDFILPRLQTAAEIQQRIYHSVEASQLLALQLHDLVYPAMTPEQGEQLRLLATQALLQQRELLHIALQQLPVSDKLHLSQWLQQGKLDAVWYPASSTTGHESKIVGFALTAEDQQGLLLPVAEPLYMPLIFRLLAPNAGDQQITQLCFGRTATSNNSWRLLPAVSQNLATPLRAGTPPMSDPAEILHALLQEGLTPLLNKLTTADSDARFTQQKLQLSEWLAQRLFFFDLSGQQDYRYIFGQAERMASIIAHREVAEGEPRDNIDTETDGVVNPFRQTIRRMMGATTILPALALQLTDATPLYGATALTSLNVNGFAGFNWDPFSRLCYLGWKKGNSRTLYVSTPESRDTLYKLADDATTSEVWPTLVRSEGLKEEFQALLQGSLSAEKFFADSVPMVWHLHCALAEASPLPAGASPHPYLADVWLATYAGVQQHFFSPAGTDGALPVVLEVLPVNRYRLTFTPSDGRIAPDLGFTLESQSFASPGQHRWVFTAADCWQLVSAEQAAQLIRQGVFSAEAWLQWGDNPGNRTTMTPTDHVLQRSDGGIVFTFDDTHSPHPRYRLLDAAGKLLFTPAQPAGWSLMTADERQSVIRQLLTAQHNRLTAITTACGLSASLPFRYAGNPEALDEWHAINLHLRAAGRNFFSEVKQRAKVPNPLLTMDELLWQRFDWRETDFYRREACDNTLKKLAQQQLLLQTMLTLLNEQHDLATLSEELRRWLHQTRHYSMQASVALQLINAQPDNSFPAAEAALHLHRQHFAENYFLSYYHLQLHITADLFLQPWQWIADDSGFARAQPGWQQTLNQLHVLATSLPHEVRVLDRLLALPDILWQSAEMQQRAQQWRELCQSMLSYWSMPRRAKNIRLVRPKATSQELEYLPQREQWPVRLLLSAGTGLPLTNQTQGLAPAQRLSAEQQEDLLLVTSGPQAPARMAGINGHPHTVQLFVAWAKLRLSSPWALAEFSGPAFLARLQQRMQTVIASESVSWTQEERDFYQAADSSAFLQEYDLSQIDKRRYAEFFRQLYYSDLLVTRLVMSDVEMVFALLCERFIEQHPKRATENISQAWFLFLHCAASPAAADNSPSLYLVGI